MFYIVLSKQHPKIQTPILRHIDVCIVYMYIPTLLSQIWLCRWPVLRDILNSGDFYKVSQIANSSSKRKYPIHTKIKVNVPAKTHLSFFNENESVTKPRLYINFICLCYSPPQSFRSLRQPEIRKHTMWHGVRYSSSYGSTLRQENLGRTHWRSWRRQ